MKSRKNIIISTALILIALILILFGMTSFFKDQPKKENEKPASQKNKKISLEDNEILFGDYIYTLPSGWKLNDASKNNVLKIYYNTIIEGVTTNIGAIISLEEIAKTGHTKEEIFKDSSFFKSCLSKAESSDEVSEGATVKFNNENVFVFPYNNDGKTKLLLAYMPAYEGFFYDIQFFSNKVVVDHTETYYNYDDIDIVFNFLNSRKKAS